MARDTVVSWRTLVLFLLFPPLAVAAVVLFPLTLAVLFWLYYRGKGQAVADGRASDAAADGPPSER
ncbi:hypothetical protein [Haloarcula litorea]|uniref:hypothetical protein n=1 Tax=Haloarcula litorea TaxID=3032579 RepID=UPI0023E8D4AA|nr:hypothetical protein [Halomicroarcula sp. GDY20]